MEGKVRGSARTSGPPLPGSFGQQTARRVSAILPAGLVLSFTLLGLALRLIRLDFQPLWWDEGYSAWFATHPLGQMVALTAEDIHPPLYYALLHVWTRIAGPGPVSLRLASVLAGVAAIPVMYAAARRILGSQGVALLAAFLLAINPLHVYYSQEVRMYGLVALLSTGVLWAAWGMLHPRQKETRFRAASPLAETRFLTLAYVVLTTLALYTQYYAIFLPLALSAYALWRLRGDARGLGRWLGLQAIVALLYLPWVVYAGPRLTLYVSQKVVQDADRPLGLVAYFARHLAAFAAGHLEGGLAGWWPAALVLLLPVLVGLILAWWRSAAWTTKGESGRKDERRKDENHHARSEGGKEALACLTTVLLVALALGWLIGLRYPFFPERGERLLLLALPAFVMLAAGGLRGLTRIKNLSGLGVVLFVGASALSLAYFYTVPRYPGDDYRPVIARTVEQGLPGDTVFCIYPWQVGYWRSYAASVDGPTAVLTPSVRWDATLQAALDDALQRGRVWFPAHLALGAILETQTEQHLAAAAIPFANTWYGPGTRLSAWQATADRSTPAAPVLASEPLATYPLAGGDLALVAAPGPTQPVPAANAVAPITLGWQALQRPALAVSVRLVDDLGQIWAQNDYEPLGAMVGSASGAGNGSPWQAVDRFGLLVPAGTPPGRYRTELLVLPSKDARPLTAELPGQPSASRIHLFDLEVAPADTPLTPDRLPITRRESVDLGDGVRFLGYTVDASALEPGRERRVNLFWQATAQPTSDYTAFVQLLGKDGSPVAAWEAAPGGAYPTSQWAAGTLIRTQAAFRPNAELPDGRYALIAGLYRPSDGLRLKTRSDQDALQLGKVSVQGRARNTVRPAPQHTVDFSFGAVGRLIGYEVSPDERRITLYWEALGATDRPYTVFVHVLDAQGQVVGYGDSEPGNGAYPTTGWRKGEFLMDEHELGLAGTLPDILTLQAAVGFYDPASGQRLPASNGQDSVRLSLAP